MTSPARLYRTADRRRLVRVGEATCEVLDWRGRRELGASGPLATDLARDLAGGRLETASRARLAAVGCVLSEPLAPVRPADLLERDGFGRLWIELVARCNERCVHCYAGSHPGAIEALDRPTVEAALVESVALGFETVQFTGGDPLLCPFLADAVRRARELGLAVEVFTNGLALDVSLLADLTSLGVSFAFSLYSDEPSAHDAVTRTPGSWDRTVDAVRRARAAGSPVRIAVVATGLNAARAGETVRFARELAGDGKVGCDVARSVGRGTFDPAVSRPAGSSGGPHQGRSSGARLGKACIAADGRVHPCIFSRWIELGRVDASGGLTAALRTPGAAGPSGDTPDLSERLTCAECRVTARELGEGARA